MADDRGGREAVANSAPGQGGTRTAAPATQALKAPPCDGHKVVRIEERGKRIARRCLGCANCAPPGEEVERREFERQRVAALQELEPIEVEAHRVTSGDLVLAHDGNFYPVLTAFPENSASASPTTIAILYIIEGEPTQRVTCNPAEMRAVKRVP